MFFDKTFCSSPEYLYSRAPAMEKLCFQRGSAEALSEKELEKPNKIPQLDPALLYKTSLQPELERTALTAELESTALTLSSLQHHSSTRACQDKLEQQIRGRELPTASVQLAFFSSSS